MTWHDMTWHDFWHFWVQKLPKKNGQKRQKTAQTTFWPKFTIRGFQCADLLLAVETAVGARAQLQRSSEQALRWSCMRLEWAKVHLALELRSSGCPGRELQFPPELCQQTEVEVGGQTPTFQSLESMVCPQLEPSLAGNNMLVFAPPWLQYSLMAGHLTAIKYWQYSSGIVQIYLTKWIACYPCSFGDGQKDFYFCSIRSLGNWECRRVANRKRMLWPFEELFFFLITSKIY